MSKPKKTIEDYLPKNERGETLYTLIYDKELMQPGCVLLQAFGGCVPDFGFLFSSETWLLHPTPGMRTLQVTLGEAKELAKRSRKRTDIAASCPQRRST